MKLSIFSFAKALILLSFSSSLNLRNRSRFGDGWCWLL